MSFNIFKDKPENPANILNNSPGPSPWYLLSAAPKITSDHNNLIWVSAGDDDISAGKVLLKTSNEDVIAIFDFYCYVLPMKQNRFLVWYEKKEQLGKSLVTKNFIELLVLDVDRLKAIDDIKLAFEEMKSKEIKVFHIDGEITSFLIPTFLNEGKHNLKFPKEFNELDEILILAHSTAGEKPSDSYGEMNLCLFIVKPREGLLEIIPQDWFNKGNFDFGYQWITRVARDPQTGKIYGEGIRLGNFVLDDTQRQIEKWLYSDTFHHPER